MGFAPRGAPPRTEDRDEDEKASVLLRSLLHYVWPAQNAGLKARVLFSFACLVAGKLLNVSVPYAFKAILDELGATADTPATISAFLPPALGALVLGCTLSAHEFTLVQFW